MLRSLFAQRHASRWHLAIGAVFATTAAPVAAQTMPPRHEVLPLAHEYLHEVWTLEDGLPVNGVTDVVQTRDGYLWLTTFDGLVRFDGARFTVFNTGTHPQLPTNRLIELHEARDGALWILTEGSLLVRFHRGRVSTFGPESGLLGRVAQTLHEDAEGTIWVGSDRDVSRYRDGNMVPLLPNPLGRSVLALHRDRAGALWIGTADGGAFRFAGDTVAAVPGTPTRVTGFYEESDGTVWLSSATAVHRARDSLTLRAGWEPVFFSRRPGDPPIVATGDGMFRVEGSSLHPIFPGAWQPGGPISMVWDTDGVRWTAKGARLYRDGREIWNHQWAMRSLRFDHEGSLWIAAYGLHRLKPALFTVYGPTEGAVANVYSMHDDGDGTLWFSSLSSGLVRLDEGGVTVFAGGNGLPTLLGAVGRDRSSNLWVGAQGSGLCVLESDGACTRGALRGSVVRAIHLDRSGTTWAGTDRGLFRLRGDRWEPVSLPPGASNSVRVVQEADDGTLWLGTHGGGVLRLRPDAGFEVLTTAHGLSSDLTRSLYLDSTGVLWVGTEGRGLNRVVLPEGGDLAAAEVTVYRQWDGLQEEVIHSIVEDDYGRLWMSSNRGIFWIARRELEAFAGGAIARVTSTNYTERDGLRNREANGGFNSASVKTRDGRLWFATQAGVAVVDPARIRTNRMPPPVAVEGVLAKGERFPALAGGVVSLPAGRRDFEIDYTALSFIAPENVRFRYQLQGLDRDWVEPGNRRTAFYTNVPPGRYRFRVIASNNDGVWNESGAALEIWIPPFFYESAWFRALGVIVLIGAVAAGAGLRVRNARRREAELVRLVGDRTRALEEETEASQRARREAEQHSRVAEEARATVAAQAEQLKELDLAKSRFFANVSHEFRTPLTLMIGPLEDLRAGLHGDVPDDVNREVSVALRNARRLLHLVDQLLDVARLESNRVVVRPRVGNFLGLLKGLLLSFSPVAERKSITVRLDEPGRMGVVWYDPDLMEKVFANLLGNAFKYTPAGGNVRVTVRQTVPVAGHPDFVDMPEGHVTVEVKDSGPGIARDDLPHIFDRFYRAATADETQGGVGIGLSLARELVELHRGRITAESDEGFGATFTVTLPRGNAHFDSSHLVDQEDWSEGPQRSQEAAAVLANDEPGTAGGMVAGADDARPTVLVVDDNAELRAFVAKHMRSRGYRVEEAADGAAGLEVARNVVPDCIICDIMMPVLDGHALCRALRADRDLDFVPVVLLTAKAEREHRLEGLGEGADDYLTKPFDPAELVARVENLIATRARLRHRSSPTRELHPAPVDVASSDEEFLRRVRDVLESRLSDTEFGVDQLAEGVGQSRSQLYRRLQEVVGHSPSELLLQFRLERGADLLAAKVGTVSEIAYGVGFKSVSHFCRRFRARYRVTPSTYASSLPPAAPTE